MSLVDMAATQEASASAGLQVLQSLSSLQASIVSENGDNAIVKTSVALPEMFLTNGADGTENVSMMKVDGKWIPADLYNGFKIAMAEAKTNIAETDFSVDGQQMLGMTMMVSMAGTFLGPLESASTQAEFDIAVQKIMQMF